MNMIKLYGKPVRVNKVKTHISLRWLSKEKFEDAKGVIRNGKLK
jgi:hypothetical protein